MAQPGLRIEELLVTERALITIADARAALKSAAVPFLALQLFHEELSCMSKQASKRALAKAKALAV